MDEIIPFYDSQSLRSLCSLLAARDVPRTVPSGEERIETAVFACQKPAGSSVCVLGYYTWNLDFLRKLSVLEVERLTIIHWIFDSISSLGC